MKIAESTNSNRSRILDVRDSGVYNGWPDLFQRSHPLPAGHPRDAINLPASWLTLVEKSRAGIVLEYQKILQEFVVQPEDELYLLGEPDQIATMTSVLHDLGYLHVLPLKEQFTMNCEWVTLKNYRRLVPAAWLKLHFPTDWQIFEVGCNQFSWDWRQEPRLDSKNGAARLDSDFSPLSEQIPGARFLGTELFEQRPLWNRKPEGEIVEILQELGLVSGCPVLLYSQNPMASARLALMMMAAGLHDVRLLDGGWQSWVRVHGTKEPALPAKVPFAKSILELRPRPDFWMDLEEARSAQLLSVRSAAEHFGLTSGYQGLEQCGEIPGAKWIDASQGAYDLDGYRNPDQTMKAAERIEQAWQKIGLDRGRRCGFYCGTGWRAAEVFFYASSMGWENISVFDGGWWEWQA